MRLQNLPRQIYCMLSGVGVSRVVGMWFHRGAGHYVPPGENEGRSRQQCHGEVCLGRTIFVSSALGAVEGRTIPVPPLILRMYLGWFAPRLGLSGSKFH